MKIFNARKLYESINIIRQHKNMTWAEVGRQAGVATKTLTGMEHDSKPNADNLAALLSWLNLPFENFIEDAPLDDQRLIGFEKADEMEGCDGRACNYT